MDDNAKKIVAQAKALRNGRDRLNATLFGRYRNFNNLNYLSRGSKVVRRYASLLGTRNNGYQIKLSQVDLEEKVFKEQMKLALLPQGSDNKALYKLQEKLIRSYNFINLAVLKTIGNKGGKTPGVDGIILQGEKNIENMTRNLLELLIRPNEYKVLPTKRVYIPKANGGERPLGIPTIADRCLQSLVKLILEPVTETTTDHLSFGFRLNRSAQNALAEIRYSLKGDYEDKFAFDADIKGFSDNITHDWIMTNVPLNPVCKIFIEIA